jgi:fructose PTS system EIIBC or EIIC component
MKISDILHKNSIKINLFVQSKDELLDEMLELAVASGNITDEDDVKREIIKRESIMSTGVGGGIALPHAKSNSINDSVGALAILAAPIDYDALDNKPVNIVFLLLGKENNVGNHLRLLSKISRLLNDDDFRAKLLGCRNSADILKLFDSVESND